MQKISLTIRVDEEDLKRWKQVAGERQLSSWIRERCNGQGSDNTDVQRAPDVPVPGRGTNPTGGREEPAAGVAAENRKDDCQYTVGPGAYCSSCGKKH